MQTPFFQYSTTSRCEGHSNNRNSNNLGEVDFTSSCQGIELDHPREYLVDLCMNLEDQVHDYYFGNSFNDDDESDVGDDIIAANKSRSSEFESSSSSSSSQQLLDNHESGAAAIHRRNLQTVQQCKIALAIGDTSRDDVLTQDEYVRFIKQLSGSQFASASSFDDLPPELQSNYDDAAGGNAAGIDIAGSKPGQTPTAAQEEQINSLCDSTIGVLNGDISAPPPPAAAPGPAEPAPGPSPSGAVAQEGVLTVREQ